MGYANLNQCLADLEAQGQLRRVDVELDPYLELAAVQRRAFRAKAPALLFTRVKGTRFPMLANLFGTRERLRYIFRDSLRAVDAVLAAKAARSAGVPPCGGPGVRWPRCPDWSACCRARSGTAALRCWSATAISPICRA